MYLNDYDGYIYPSYGHGQELTWAYGKQLAPYLLGRNEYHSAWGDKRNRPPFTCPSDKNPYAVGHPFTLFYCSYVMWGYRYWSDSQGKWVGYRQKLITHPKPSTYALKADGTHYHFDSFGNVEARHTNGVNVLYIDGHVGYVPKPAGGYTSNDIPYGSGG